MRCDPISSDNIMYRKYFNPRTSCEVRPGNDSTVRLLFCISIHAPRVRCDKIRYMTRPSLCISIHAPRVRCDSADNLYNRLRCYFNPRTSCEVRPDVDSKLTIYANFNPRTSCEVRLYSGGTKKGKTIFQSTHLV